MDVAAVVFVVVVAIAIAVVAVAVVVAAVSAAVAAATMATTTAAATTTTSPTIHYKKTSVLTAVPFQFLCCKFVSRPRSARVSCMWCACVCVWMCVRAHHAHRIFSWTLAPRPGTTDGQNKSWLQTRAPCI